MSIDEELKQAVEESEASANQERDAQSGAVGDGFATPAQPALAHGDPEDDDSSPRRNLGLVVGLLVVCAAILFFVFNLEDATYAKTVEEVIPDKSALEGRKLRVQGVLVHGSLKKREEPCEYRFKMRTQGQVDSAALEVRYGQCIVPDTFRDVKGMEVQVTAEGRLADSGYLEASQIFAKCPSKYEMQQRQAAGEKAPHGPGKPPLNPMDTIGKDPSQGS